MGVAKEKVRKDYEKKKRKEKRTWVGFVCVCGGKVTPRDKD